MTHTHYANGLRGYLPDTVECFDSEAEAIDFARDMFSDLCEDCFAAMAHDLTTSGSHDFEACDSCAPGAEYVEVEPEPSCEAA